MVTNYRRITKVTVLLNSESNGPPESNEPFESGGPFNNAT